jgi:hypothetical protein
MGLWGVSRKLLGSRGSSGLAQRRPSAGVETRCVGVAECLWRFTSWHAASEQKEGITLRRVADKRVYGSNERRTANEGGCRTAKERLWSMQWCRGASWVARLGGKEWAAKGMPTTSGKRQFGTTLLGPDWLRHAASRWRFIALVIALRPLPLPKLLQRVYSIIIASFYFAVSTRCSWGAKSSSVKITFTMARLRRRPCQQGQALAGSGPMGGLFLAAVIAIPVSQLRQCRPEDGRSTNRAAPRKQQKRLRCATLRYAASFSITTSYPM